MGNLWAEVANCPQDIKNYRAICLEGWSLASSNHPLKTTGSNAIDIAAAWNGSSCCFREVLLTEWESTGRKAVTYSYMVSKTPQFVLHSRQWFIHIGGLCGFAEVATISIGPQLHAIRQP